MDEDPHAERRWDLVAARTGQRWPPQPRWRLTLLAVSMLFAIMWLVRGP